MELLFPLPYPLSSPLVIRYNPALKVQEEQYFFNPILGYPKCPILGRYNKGQYKLAEVAAHIGFDCRFVENKGYQCGEKQINLPLQIVQALQQIPQLIPHNKSVSQEKNTKILDFHPIHFPVLKKLTFNWIISYGEIGKDFLNYINHTYIFGQEIMTQDKLKRNVHMLPIMVHFPLNSGFCVEEVQRGISIGRLRSEYMSIHLKFGAPAFSPNNMRLGIEGMPKVTSNNNKKKQNIEAPNNKKKKKIYVEKQSTVGFEKSVKQNAEEQHVEDQNNQFIDSLFAQKPDVFQKQQVPIVQKQDLIKQDQKQKKKTPEIDPPKKQHPGFLHFYSTILLQQDYRVNYHWHIEDEFRQKCMRELLKRSKSIEDLIQEYISFTGGDSMSFELKRLLGWQ